MLALGADGVLLGRAWVYALAARGQSGVETLLDLIEREMRDAMSLSGCTRIDEVNRSILASSCGRGERETSGRNRQFNSKRMTRRTKPTYSGRLEHQTSTERSG